MFWCIAVAGLRWKFRRNVAKFLLFHTGNLVPASMLNKHSGLLHRAEMRDEDERTIFDGRIVNASMSLRWSITPRREGLSGLANFGILSPLEIQPVPYVHEVKGYG